MNPITIKFIKNNNYNNKYNNMGKLKCDVCKEKHDRMHLSVECGDCYLKGFDKERKKLLEDFKLWAMKEFSPVIAQSSKFKKFEKILQSPQEKN